MVNLEQGFYQCIDFLVFHLRANRHTNTVHEVLHFRLHTYNSVFHNELALTDKVDRQLAALAKFLDPFEEVALKALFAALALESLMIIRAANLLPVPK
jgi:hypothetical protein